MTIERMLFKVIYQHFEEGLFEKTLSMDQALRLANLIMNHVPMNERKQTVLNPNKIESVQQRLLPANTIEAEQ